MPIKSGHPEAVYVIAEAGVNHNGKRDLAFALVESAAAAGADAVKFQTFDATKLAAAHTRKAAYQEANSPADETQREMLRRLELPHKWHRDLQKHARRNSIEFLSTAFDQDSLAFLLKLGIPRLKVPSGELTNAPLLWRFARSRRPLVLSTGMATLSEVEQGLAVVAHGLHARVEPSNMDEVWKNWCDNGSRRALRGHVTLLHCTSQYPTRFGDVNLRGMVTLASAFGLDVGYSDHTEGIVVAIAAVALGASIIEKHFTLDRSLPGPDHAASLEPAELKQMVTDIRRLQLAMGDGTKAPQTGEWDTRRAARQQVVAARAIRAGTVLRREHLTTARSEHGLAPSELWGLVGRVTRRPFRAGEAVEL